MDFGGYKNLIPTETELKKFIDDMREIALELYGQNVNQNEWMEKFATEFNNTHNEMFEPKFYEEYISNDNLECSRLRGTITILGEKRSGTPKIIVYKEGKTKQHPLNLTFSVEIGFKKG